MLLASTTSSLLTQTMTYTAPVVHASTFEDQVRQDTGNFAVSNEEILQLIDASAARYKIASSTLWNLLWSESRLNPIATSSTGDFGIAQLNLAAHPEIATSSAFDPGFAIDWTAKQLGLGKESQWTVCSCVTYARTLIPSLPHQDASAFVPNATFRKGIVAIFHYKNGKAHVGITGDFDAEGFWMAESNYLPCKTDKRYVRFDDPALAGFWQPSP